MFDDLLRIPSCLAGLLFERSIARLKARTFAGLRTLFCFGGCSRPSALVFGCIAAIFQATNHFFLFLRLTQRHLDRCHAGFSGWLLGSASELTADAVVAEVVLTYQRRPATLANLTTLLIR